MKRLWLTLLFVASIPALAQTSPEVYYQQLAGRWQGTVENVDLTYAVEGNTVAVQGEECSSNAPVVCGIIDQAYRMSSNTMLRSYQNYGSQPVEIVELNARKIVKREIHPKVANRIAVTTEELLDDDTLSVTAELWAVGENEPRVRRAYTLKRVDIAPVTQ